MTEKRLIISDLGLSYSGYFHASEVYKIINKFALERGYDWKETLNEVIVKEDHRNITLKLEPSKSISDYVKTTIKVEAEMSDVTDEEIEIDGKKITVNKGKVKVDLKGIMLSDYEGDWQSTAWRVFIRTIKDKFVYRDYTKSFEDKLKKDVMRLRNELSSFLNLNKYVR